MSKYFDQIYLGSVKELDCCVFISISRSIVKDKNLGSVKYKVVMVYEGNEFGIIMEVLKRYYNKF